MSMVIGKPEKLVELTPEKHFFQVFLAFRKPNGYLSAFFDGSNTGCGVNQALGLIFNRSAREIYMILFDLVKGIGDGFMREYLSLEEASAAVAKASLLAHTVKCDCFLKQEAYFHIKETTK